MNNESWAVADGQIKKLIKNMKLRSQLFTTALIIFSFAIAGNVWAHEPRYIQDDQLVLIKNPDVSQAFYSELKGAPAYYLIDLKQAQDLHFQILVPDLPGIQMDKTVKVDYTLTLGQPAANFLSLDPGSTVWTKFYEEYAGDNYWQGRDELPGRFVVP